MKNQEQITITKYSGESAPFDGEKLRLSLKRSGAADKVIDQVVTQVEGILYEGISTKEIYKKAFSLLRKKARPSAARYNLKKALFEFGPTGFPFELFVAELLNAKGFKTKTGQLVQGHCVQHEVDVIAIKGEAHFMVECKFHSSQGRRCDVKIPLYIQSRFKDVEAAWLEQPGHNINFHQGWVATNTRFTSDAIQYGKCVGLYLLSWDYPFNNALKEWVSETGSHPVTCLTTLSRKEKQQLLESGIILCRQLCEKPETLNQLALTESRRRKVLEEAGGVCDIQ
jgi:hypothetical protein